jgi:hypothetical protein
MYLAGRKVRVIIVRDVFYDKECIMVDKRVKNQWFQDIRYSFLENIAFGMMALFMVKP